jgi:hypothetical protein
MEEEILALAVRWAGFAAVATLLPASLWIGVRRWLATPTAPPISGAVAAISGLSIVALFMLIRFSQRMNPRTNGSGWAAMAAKRSPLWWSLRHFGPYAVLTLTALLFAFALSIPGQPTWSTLGLWTLLTATETWAWRSRFGSTAAREVMASPLESESPPSRPPEIVDAATEPTSATGATAAEAGEQPSRAEQACDEQAGEVDRTNELERADGAAEETEDETADTAEEDAQPKAAKVEPEELAECEALNACEELAECDESELLAAGVGQQWTRGGNANDGEWIEAVTRVGLEAGQRHAVLHLTFCPPLTVVPTLHAYVVEGVPADVVVAERRVYGARLELRIKQPIAIASDAIVLARAETAPAALSSGG